MNQINKKMSLLEKISYGSGNMGICLCTTLITTFIMYFYTDVVKISVLQVGTIMLIGGIADAVSDAVMGIIEIIPILAGENAGRILFLERYLWQQPVSLCFMFRMQVPQ